MKFNEMNLEEKRKYFKERIRGGDKSAVNMKRTQEAKEFHKRFNENKSKQKNNIIEKELGE